MSSGIGSSYPALRDDNNGNGYDSGIQPGQAGGNGGAGTSRNTTNGKNGADANGHSLGNTTGFRGED